MATRYLSSKHFVIPHSLITDPRVMRIAAELAKMNPEAEHDALVSLALGAICRVLSWAESHASAADVATVAMLSDVARIDGFGEAMRDAGLIEETDTGIRLKI